MDVRELAADLAAHLDTVAVGNAHIEYGHIGLRCTNSSQGLGGA
ncbi:unannotated protein [freshwater metagenome]|uniref:Unannotated protein n=1 Tax=freshwater metagenome TaxID=449393 RepID=A0A6J6XXC9_9ZZZZ